MQPEDGFYSRVMSLMNNYRKIETYTWFIFFIY